MLLVKKCQFLHYLFLLKLRLETRFNNVPDRKETFSDCKKKVSDFSKIEFFQRGSTHSFGQKMPIFSLFVFAWNKTRNKV